MQKGKHQGGQTQGFSHRNYTAYPGNPDTSRQYTREVPAFHASGTPGGGPGMRGMHHAPPTQPPTPPTSQDIKQPPTHLPPQSHPMPPQSGGQMMQYTVTGAGRGNSQQAPFYNAQRGPSGVQRLAPHPRAPMIMSSNPQSFIHQQTVPPVYPSSLVSPVSGQPPVFVTPHMNQSFQIQAQQRHQSGYYPQQFVIQQPHHIFQGSYPPMYYSPQIQPMSRPGGPAPTSQGTAPPQPQTAGMAVITGATGSIVQQTAVHQQPKQIRRKSVLKIIDPSDGRNIMDEILVNNSTPPKSGESSARQTPQPNSEQKTDPGVAAEFATRVAIAARSDRSGSPNSPALQQQPSSRASNYSENESQASPDTQGMSTPSVSPSKLDMSVDNMSSEGQIVENNLTYDAQQATMMRPGWPPMMTQVELMSLPIHSGLIISDDLMRGGAPPNQPPREYQPMPPQWIPDPVPVSVIISKEASAPMETAVRPGPERVPVVSALTLGPTVEIAPRHQREQFPALVKGHQQPSPVKRKQRLEPTQEQPEGRIKESQQPQQQHQHQHHPPQQQQQPPPPPAPPQQQQQQQQQPAPQAQPPKTAPQPKPKTLASSFESKKQSLPPSQDSDDYVQSIQMRNSESKTISIKKNEANSSETKVKPNNDSLLSKEINNLETRTSNDENFQDHSNRNKSEVVKSEVSLPVEKSPQPHAEENSAKAAPEEAQEAQPPPAALEPEPQNVSAPVEEAPPLKANGEAVADDAKQNTQKQKTGSKRQSQSKMRLEKETRNAERPESTDHEIAPAALLETKIAHPLPVVAVTSGQQEETTKLQEENAYDEVLEMEKEDRIVAVKNEENNKQTATLKINDTASNTPVIENVNKAVLKHNYKQDQWSPINPDGKKKYDRDFIMELMDDPQSRRRPENLPNLDLLKDNTKQRSSDRNFLNAMSRDSSEISLYPNFGNKNSSQRSSQIFQKKGSQTTKPKVAKPPVIHMSLHQDVKLHETENAWKPARNADYNNMTDEEIKTEELFKRVRGVLNKLTPEKFSTLVDQVKTLQIDNHARLKGVIDLVFEKAVDEPSFSVAYAQMCSNLQTIQVPSGDYDDEGKPNLTSFKKLLISRCQVEFEKDTTAEMKRKEEKLKEIELETDPEKKKTLQLMFEEDERRVRMKSVGNSRFIGELYKLKMLTSNIMHKCIARLLNEGDEESLECLCKLLTTVGRGLESKVTIENKASSDNNKSEQVPDLNNYFKKLAEIVRNRGSKKVSSRVRFMIQDLIDLRNNKWVPRRDETNPKTIDQIQKEAERETMEMSIALNSPMERNKRQDSRNFLDNRKRGGGGADSSGWMTVQSQNRGKHLVESAKLKIDQSEVEVGSTVSLGNRNQFAIWGQGLGGGKMDDKKMRQLGANMFAVLNDKISQPSSRNSSLKGPSLSDKDRMFSSYKSNYDDDLRSSRSGSQQGPDSRSSSRDSVSSKHDDRRYINPSGKSHAPSSKPAAAPSNPSAEAKSPEILQKRAQLLLDEYLNCLEFEEAEFSVKSTFTDSSMNDFVVHISRVSMEMSGSAPKRAVGKLMNYFIKKNIISKRDYLDGMSKMLEAADDLALDMPLIWVYLAEVIVDTFVEESLTFIELADLLKPRQGSYEVAKLLSSLLDFLVKEKGETWLEQRWILSRVSLSDMIKEKDVDNFVKQIKLEFLLEKSDINNLSMDTIKGEIYKMISNKTSFDTITTWIDKNVSPDRRSKPLFVRTLMTALLEATVLQIQSYKFDTDTFSNYEQLIVRYTDHCEELELSCLFAIQAYIHKLEYPPGVLSSIFDHLWDRELIALESFRLWVDSKDPQEQEGHAVCVKSLTSFFTVLNETSTDDDES